MTTIKFKGNTYEVSEGNVFQAKLINGRKGQIFIVQCNPYEKVTLEVIQKISSYISLLKVNKIECEEQLLMELKQTEAIKEEEFNKFLSGMTKKELINYIENNGIDIDPKGMKKLEIIIAIKENK